VCRARWWFHRQRAALNGPGLGGIRQLAFHFLIGDEVSADPFHRAIDIESAAWPPLSIISRFLLSVPSSLYVRVALAPTIDLRTPPGRGI
jgi:hypothetical protein